TVVIVIRYTPRSGAAPARRGHHTAAALGDPRVLLPWAHQYEMVRDPGGFGSESVLRPALPRLLESRGWSSPGRSTISALTQSGCRTTQSYDRLLDNARRPGGRGDAASAPRAAREL